MLPSPRCPNGSGRAAGMSLATAAFASAMKAGTAATGTETSCLIEPPSWRCTSPNISRMRQNIFCLIEALGDGGILHEFALQSFRENFFQHRAQAGARLRGELEKHVPRVRLRQRIAAACAMAQ